ncbi:hypothetical protein GBP346_B0309 [Burkholderia pseudomallei MSHR346]|nr:hypothetical protein GBP346_B0309 [Burkholderia pseudomallei MSHR346]
MKAGFDDKGHGRREMHSLRLHVPRGSTNLENRNASRC